MKSITVTTHRAINYGAVLQAYALQQKQLEIGIENKILDYETTDVLYEAVTNKSPRSCCISIIINFFTFFNIKKRKRLIKGFNSFVTKNLILTDICYDTIDAEKICLKSDFLITGSDQVFSVRSELKDIRMLNFCTNEIKKISYAASLGEYDWNKEELLTVKKILEKYSLISVREEYTKKYLNNSIGINCSVNIDPVFLIEKTEWEKLLRKPDFKERYVLCYHLISNPNTQSVLNKIKKEFKLKIVCLQTNFVTRIKADKYIFTASPEEFLGWINNAECVVTTSFHGTSFSVIFEKPFYTLIKDYKSERITNLLEKFNLSNRVIRDTDKIKDLNLNIDFSKSKKIIKEERLNSVLYLRKACKLCNDK